MTSILLIISFLLHLILLATVYYLFQQIQEMKTEHSRDTEQLLARFLDEIRQENRQLEHQLTHPRDHRDVAFSKETPSREHDKWETEKSETFFTLSDTVPEYHPMPTDKTDKVETSMESRVFQLHQAGLTANDIAKQLDCGKTEVDLLLKLNKFDS